MSGPPVSRRRSALRTDEVAIGHQSRARASGLFVTRRRIERAQALLPRRPRFQEHRLVVLQLLGELKDHGFVRRRTDQQRNPVAGRFESAWQRLGQRPSRPSRDRKGHRRSTRVGQGRGHAAPPAAFRRAHQGDSRSRRLWLPPLVAGGIRPGRCFGQRRGGRDHGRAARPAVAAPRRRPTNDRRPSHGVGRRRTPRCSAAPSAKPRSDPGGRSSLMHRGATRRPGPDAPTLRAGRDGSSP